MPRLRHLAAALAALLVLASAPSVAPAAAQDSAAAAVQPSADSATAAAPYATSADALPATAAPPRTLRAYWHVFIAFALAWLLVFGYALSLGRRFRKLEKDVESMGRGSPS